MIKLPAVRSFPKFILVESSQSYVVFFSLQSMCVKVWKCIIKNNNNNQTITVQKWKLEIQKVKHNTHKQQLVISYIVIRHIRYRRIFFVHFRQLLSPVGLFSLLRYAATYFRLFKDYFCVIKLPKIGNKLQKTEIHSYFLILAFLILQR